MTAHGQVTTEWCWGLDDGSRERLFDHRLSVNYYRGSAARWTVSIATGSRTHTIPMLVYGFKTRREAEALYRAAAWLMSAPGEHGRRPALVETDISPLPFSTAVKLDSLHARALFFFHGHEYTLVRAEGVHPEVLPHLEEIGFVASNVCGSIQGFIGLLRN